MTKEGWLTLWAAVSPYLIIGLAYLLKRFRLYILAVKEAKAAGQPAPPFQPIPVPIQPTDNGNSGADKRQFMDLCSVLYDIAVQRVAPNTPVPPDTPTAPWSVY